MMGLIRVVGILALLMCGSCAAGTGTPKTQIYILVDLSKTWHNADQDSRNLKVLQELGHGVVVATDDMEQPILIQTRIIGTNSLERDPICNVMYEATFAPVITNDTDRISGEGDLDSYLSSGCPDTRAHFDEMVSNAANTAEILNAKQKENAQLRAKLAGNGGTDLPNCPVTAGFIVRINALPSGGFSVSPLWSRDAAPMAAKVTGLSQLATSAPISTIAFRSLASQMKAWGERQGIPCGFRARMVAQHENLNQFIGQQRIAAQYFYLAI